MAPPCRRVGARPVLPSSYRYPAGQRTRRRKPSRLESLTAPTTPRPTATGEGGEQCRIVLRALQALRSRRRVEAGRHQPVGRIGERGQHLVSRVVKSPPRQTRSIPITSTACSRWSMTRSSVRSRARSPVDAASGRRGRRGRERRASARREVAWVVVDARHVAWEHISGAPPPGRGSRRSRREAWARSRMMPRSTSRSTSARPSRESPPLPRPRRRRGYDGSR